MANFNIDELLRGDLHLAAEEFEDYILGRLDEKSKHRIELHLHVCSICSYDLAILRPYIDPDNFHGETPKYEWSLTAKFWISDSQYTLKPMADDPAVALIEGMTLSHLMNKWQADEKDPGTYLIGVENNTMPLVFPLVFPLYQFAWITNNAAMTVTGSIKFQFPLGLPQTSPAESLTSTEKIFQYKARDVVIDVLSNRQNQVFLYLLPPTEV